MSPFTVGFRHIQVVLFILLNCKNTLHGCGLNPGIYHMVKGIYNEIYVLSVNSVDIVKPLQKISGIYPGPGFQVLL